MQLINVIKYKVRSYDFVLLALNLSELTKFSHEQPSLEGNLC